MPEKPARSRKAARGPDPLAAERAALLAMAAGSPRQDLESVSAESLAAVLGEELPERTCFSGLTIRGALTARAPAGERTLVFSDCRFDGAVRFENARLRGLTLAACRLGALTLRDCQIDILDLDDLAADGHVRLDGLQARQIQLRACEIGGMVSLNGAAVAGDVTIASGRMGAGKIALQAEHAVIGRTLWLGGAPAAEALHLDGRIDLTAAHVDTLVLGARAQAVGLLDLRRATIDTVLAREGAQMGGVRLGRAVIGDLEIEPGVDVGGPLTGENLTVAGRVVLESRHHGGGQPAIDLAGARVAGEFRLGRAFVCEGAVRLVGCEVEGAVALGGRIETAAGNGLDVSRLSAARLEVGFEQLRGGVSIRQSTCTGLLLAGDYACPPDHPLHLGVSCSGRATLGAAGRPVRLAGVLSLIDHRCRELVVGPLSIDAPKDGRWAGVAIAARHLVVEAFARFGQVAGEVACNGLVALDYARLGDDVRFCGLQIAAPAGDALAGQGAGPRGLSLHKAQVEGDLDLGGLTLGAAGGETLLDLSAARIGGALRAGGLALTGSWRIDLSDSVVGRLDDAHGLAWSALADTAPTLAIATFRYAEIEGLSDEAAGLAPRLAWIEAAGRAARDRDGAFSPQPYRALAGALNAAGRADRVKRVEIEALRQQRRLGDGSWLGRLGDAVLEITSGYGYSAARALATLVVYFLIGWAGVTLANHQGAFETSPFIDGSVLAPARAQWPHGCPWLQPPLYALDLMVPVTTLGNENFCSVRIEAGVWQWAQILYRLGGWVVISIALLTFSGILKRSE